MGRYRILQYSLLLILPLLLLSSCRHSGAKKTPSLYQICGVAMTVPYKVVISCSEQDRVRQLALEKEIESVFSYIDSTFNTWNPSSEISLLNQWEKGKPFSCSWDLFYFLLWTDSIVQKTQGLFDPTIETINSLWKKTLKEGTEPSSDLLRQTQEAASWKSLSFDLSTASITKRFSETKLDLGGIVKGYTVDLLVERLRHISHDSSVYVDWGGEIGVSKAHPEGRPWKVMIYTPPRQKKEETPSPIDPLPIVIEMSQTSLATSGDYFQRWTVEGKNGKSPVEYTHVFAPGDMKPLQEGEYDISSVSVLHPSCATADALGTALFACKNIKRARKVIPHIQQAFGPVTIWIITKNGDRFSFTPS